MPIKKSDLYSSLWASCDELCGGMDGDVVLVDASEYGEGTSRHVVVVTRTLKQAMKQEVLTRRMRLV